MEANRRFYRMICDTAAELAQNEQTWATQLMDLSLQGAMVAIPEGWQGQEGENYHLRFSLADSDIVIEMDMQLRKIIGTKGLGLECHHIDIDSATHLKRMIELNVGDDTELHRELEYILENHGA